MSILQFLKAVVQQPSSHVCICPDAMGSINRDNIANLNSESLGL